MDDQNRDQNAAEERPAASADAPAPASTEPSHEAVGIGVVGVGDHHGQDGGRETLTAGEAQRSLDGDQAQHLPAMAQNNASDVEKIAGIAAQTRSDVGTEGEERIADVLRQRLEQSGIDLPDDEVAELARQVSGGDAA